MSQNHQGSEKAGESYDMASALGLTDDLTRSQGLNGRRRNSTYQGRLLEALSVADEFLQLAQGTDALAWAHASQAEVLLLKGDAALSLVHAKACVEAYDRIAPNRRSTLIKGFAGEAKIPCLAYASIAFWWLGAPEQARLYIEKSLHTTEEETPFRVLGQAFALNWVAMVQRERGVYRESRTLAEQAIVLSETRQFPFYLAWGKVTRGSALVAEGQWEDGIELIRQGVKEARDAEAKRPSVLLQRVLFFVGFSQSPVIELGQTYFLGLLGEAYLSVGKLEEARKTLNKAVAIMNKTEERIYEPELYRLKGELLLAQNGRAASGAAAYFHQAIETARRQKAKSLELRATMSLARLWQHQGRQSDARKMLSKVYSGFTEGFETKDLRDAKRLLAALS